MESRLSKKDIVELISNYHNEIQTKVFTNEKMAENVLKKYSANIRLDYHGIVDILNIDEKLIPDDIRNKFNICVISYVGKYSENRSSARLDIIDRIKTGQIDFGLLIFKRCRDKIICDNFHDVGSKAWANSLIQTNGKSIFIDDSEDHYKSVQSMNIPNLKSIIFNGNKKELIDLIKKEMVLNAGSYYIKYIKYKHKYLNKKNLL